MSKRSSNALLEQMIAAGLVQASPPFVVTNSEERERLHAERRMVELAYEQDQLEARAQAEQARQEARERAERARVNAEKQAKLQRRYDVAQAEQLHAYDNAFDELEELIIPNKRARENFFDFKLFEKKKHKQPDRVRMLLASDELRRRRVPVTLARSAQAGGR